jgi:hypothetical protein
MALTSVISNSLQWRASTARRLQPRRHFNRKFNERRLLSAELCDGLYEEIARVRMLQIERRKSGRAALHCPATTMQSLAAF